MASTSVRPSAPPVEAAPPSTRVHSLDTIAQLAPDALHALYRSARTPRVEDLDGPLQGRMLAVPSLQKPIIATLLRRYTGSRQFPWQGKTFWSVNKGHGEGINRVLGNRFNWFRFTTAVKPSLAGDFDAVQFDYDHPDNPALIRAIQDEVRTVAPGLWLGLAYVKMQNRYHLGCYFALAKPAGSVRSNKSIASGMGPAWVILALLLPVVAISLWLLWPRLSACRDDSPPTPN